MRMTIEAAGAEISIREMAAQGPAGRAAETTAPEAAADALDAGPAVVPGEAVGAPAQRLETATVQGAAGDVDGGPAPTSEGAGTEQQGTMMRQMGPQERMLAAIEAGPEAIDAGTPNLPPNEAEGNGGAKNG